jgi:hypothetical protein
MFESGVVKLTWGDKTWLDLRALDFHFETQCIPHWVAWYLHQLPPSVHKVLCAFTMGAEMAAPFCIVLPRHWRHGGAFAMILLQGGIILTGNFAFFNWLTIALCLPLFDDRFWSRALPHPPSRKRRAFPSGNTPWQAPSRCSISSPLFLH